MSIKINILPRNAILPKDFKAGKVYASHDGHKYLVLGTKKMEFAGKTVTGVSCDGTADPWYTTDEDVRFYEVDITVEATPA